jgi:HSP20 family molecular chaperone IbpA
MATKKADNKQTGATAKPPQQTQQQTQQQQQQQQPSTQQLPQQPIQQPPIQAMPPFAGPPPMVPPPHPLGPPPMVVPPPMVPPPAHSLPNSFPRIDRTDDEKNYYVYADVPGLTKDQIKVEIKENMLVLSGERKSDHLNKRKNPPAENKKNEDPVLQLFPIIECFYGPFQRSIPIPADGDISTFKTKIENGVLEIVVKKSEVKKTEEKKTEEKKPEQKKTEQKK